MDPNQDLEQARLAQLLQLLHGPQQPQGDMAPRADNGYNLEAQDLVHRASALEKQATPTPGPTTTGGKIAEGLRAGLEGFTGGFTGGPGYFEHQQIRDTKEHQRQQDLLGRAKELRGEGVQQQQLGMTALAHQDTEAHNAALLEEAKRVRGNAEHKEAFEEEVANRPKPWASNPGDSYGTFDPKTGHITPQGTTPKAPTLQHVILNVGGKPEVWAVDMASGKPHSKIGDAVVTQGANGMVQVTYTDETTGQPTVGVMNKGSNTITPAHIAGQSAPVQTATAGNKAVGENAKAFATAQEAERLYNTMRDTLARIDSGQSKSLGADDLVLLSNHIAMTFGTVKGARTGKDLIREHLKARSLPAELEVVAHQVLDGGQLSQGQRHEFVHLAEQRTAELKKQEAEVKAHYGGGGAPAGAPTPTNEPRRIRIN